MNVLVICRSMAVRSLTKSCTVLTSESASRLQLPSAVRAFASKSDNKDAKNGSKSNEGFPKADKKMSMGDNTTHTGDRKETKTGGKTSDSSSKAASKAPSGGASANSSVTSPSANKQNASGGSGKKIQSADYKVQEYFQHTPLTYYDFERDMVGDRLKQPSPYVKEGQAEAKK